MLESDAEFGTEKITDQAFEVEVRESIEVVGHESLSRR
jgi:hypothetical protein